MSSRPLPRLEALSPPDAVGAMRAAWRQHWPEYLIEGAGLALFMISACLTAALLEYPASPVRQAIDDAGWYVIAQFAGGVIGVMAASWILGPQVVSHPSVNHVVTSPGMHRAAVAFAAEAIISFGLMLAVLQGEQQPVGKYRGGRRRARN